MIPSRCAEDAGSGWPCLQLKGPGLLQKSIQPLKCWSAAWLSRGMSFPALNLSLWHTPDWHWQTHTVCGIDGHQRWPGHQRETWWMKGFDVGNLFRHLTHIFCFRRRNNFTIFFHIKKIPVPCWPGLWPRFRLETETHCTCSCRGLEMWHRC